MAITYIAKAKKSPRTGTVKYYAQIAPITAPLTLDDVTERIAAECTVTEHDVKAVISALQEQVLLALRAGQSVRLGDLGSFRPTLTSTAADTAEAVTADNITAVRVHFTKSARLAANLRKGARGISFQKPYETDAESDTAATAAAAGA